MAIDSLNMFKQQPQDFVSSAQLSQASQKPVAPGPRGANGSRAMGEVMAGFINPDGIRYEFVEVKHGKTKPNGTMIHDDEWLWTMTIVTKKRWKKNLEPHIWAHFFKTSSACSTKVAGVGPDFSVVIWCCEFTPKGFSFFFGKNEWTWDYRMGPPR